MDSESARAREADVDFKLGEHVVNGYVARLRIAAARFDFSAARCEHYEPAAVAAALRFAPAKPTLVHPVITATRIHVGVSVRF